MPGADRGSYSEAGGTRIAEEPRAQRHRPAGAFELAERGGFGLGERGSQTQKAPPKHATQRGSRYQFSGSMGTGHAPVQLETFVKVPCAVFPPCSVDDPDMKLGQDCTSSATATGRRGPEGFLFTWGASQGLDICWGMRPKCYSAASLLQLDLLRGSLWKEAFMKRVLFALATGLLASQALAADLPMPAPPPRAPAAYVPVAPVFTWTGCYIGANGGWAVGKNDWTVTGTGPGGPAIGTSTGNFNVSGFLVGGTVGANYQISWAVLGAEGDLDWADIKGNAGAFCGGIGAVAAYTCETKESWLGTARARAGVALDRVLLYLTGGAAFGNVKATVTPGGLTDTTTKVGWTAGGGAEFALTPNITAKIEYLFVDLQNGSCTTACLVAPGPVTSADVTFKENIVRGGLNYKF